MPIHMHNHNIFMYICIAEDGKNIYKYSFPSLGYQVMAEDGKIIEIKAIKER